MPKEEASPEEKYNIDKVCISRSTYILQLLTTNNIDDRTSDEIVKDVRNIKKTTEKRIRESCVNKWNYYGINGCRICHYAENYPIEKLEKIMPDGCTKMQNDFGITSCKDCIESNANTQGKCVTCDNLELSMAIPLGTYDFAFLWRCPSYFWGSLIAMNIRQNRGINDILCIPCHRVEWPHEKPGDRGDVLFKKSVICFTFLELRNLDPKTLTELLEDLYKLRMTGNNNMEVFLTYCSYPVLIKSEFENDEDSWNFTLKLCELKNVQHVSTTHTVSLTGGEKITRWLRKEEVRLKNENDIKLHEFLLALKIKKIRSEKTINKICKEISSAASKSSILEVGEPYDCHGFWDCVVPISAPSSKSLIGFTTKFVRGHLILQEKKVSQSITLPLWAKKDIGGD